jgi:Ca2+-binding EF-hand superfamily protein
MKKYLVLLFALMFSVGLMAQQPEFDEVDTNNDGFIDREEAAAVEGLDFDAADTNQDGVIDRQEYEEWLEQQ